MNTLTLSHLHAQLPALPCWEQHFDTLAHRIGKHFTRSDARQQARHYLQGLLSPVQRKNGWQLAEYLGHSNPYRVQHLLDRAVWDAEAVRDDLLRYVVEHLGDPGGVLIIDETGFLKKGDKSVGVQRQYSGTAGRVENCQVGVFLAYATQKGHTFLDRALYLPQDWAHDPARREQAKVPEEVSFATKPYLAQQMLAGAFAAGVPCAWVTGDSVYGSDRKLRAFLEARKQAYVLAVACDEKLAWEQGRIRAKTLAQRLPASRWQTLSAGEGEKGPRLYDWACLLLDAPEQTGFCRWLLVRKSLSEPSERAYYVVFASADTPLATMVAVAGTRWSIEVGLEAAKGEVGLDEYEVRSFHGWYRHITLSLLAHAFLAVMRAKQIEPDAKGGKTAPGNCLRHFKQSRGLCCP
jgi:SRSO17 transposase